MALSLMRGRRVTLSKVDAFADGVAVKQASEVSLRPLTNTAVRLCTAARGAALVTPRPSQASPLIDWHAILPANPEANDTFCMWRCYVMVIEGTAISMQVGMETFRMCRGLLDGVIQVDNSAISAAIKDVFNETRSILEPAGAVAVAGAKAYLSRSSLQARPSHSWLCQWQGHSHSCKACSFAAALSSNICALISRWLSYPTKAAKWLRNMREIVACRTLQVSPMSQSISML